MHTTNITNHLNSAVKSKRSQSALEYMMTYGWAILIIVIVAVILYSMGIFNPSSSVTFTSSGFSPFTVSSSLCNNLGYKIAIIAGPMPNNANYITINKVFVTSATGANTTTASYTLTNPVTLKSGQSATILIPNVACTAAKVHYSFSAKIQYSYTASTLGLQTINTTGTVAGTSISGKPSTLTTYEPIIITNTQSSATPSPFQQMINFTSSDPGFSLIATGNFGQNVEFFYYNGTVIPSWLENYTSTNATWWLKIAAIPAGSSETIYVGFAPKTTNLFNTNDVGEAPLLSSSYGEYDDGPGVFNYYTNFNGTSLPSSFEVYNTPSGISVDNGVTLSQYSTGSTIYYTSDIALNTTAVMTGEKIYDPNGGTSMYSFYPQFGSFFNDQSDGGLGNYGGTQYDIGIVTNNTGRPSVYTNMPISTSSSVSAAPLDTSVIWLSTNLIYVLSSVNNVLYKESTTDLSLTPHKFFYETGSSYAAKITIYYSALLAVPPNGVMPSVSFDSVA